MKTLLKKLICKHDYHTVGVFDYYSKGITKQKTIRRCYKCDKIKESNKIKRYNMDKVRV